MDPRYWRTVSISRAIRSACRDVRKGKATQARKVTGGMLRGSSSWLCVQTPVCLVLGSSHWLTVQLQTSMPGISDAPRCHCSACHWPASLPGTCRSLRPAGHMCATHRCRCEAKSMQMRHSTTSTHTAWMRCVAVAATGCCQPARVALSYPHQHYLPAQ
jgi:hypothetical protein